MSEHVEISPRSLSGAVANFSASSYGGTFAELQSLGLFIIGVDFYTSKSEVAGRFPPEWRAYFPAGVSSWIPEDEAQRWSQTGLAAFERKDGRVWDISIRVSHQMRVCAWRLRQISEAYSQQLQALTLDGAFEPGQRFEDGFTWLGYLAIQAFLVDACVLRDYLMELCSSTIYQQPSHRITSMGGLLKSKILNAAGLDDLLASTLRTAANAGGWLHQLGQYRDLTVHSAPLASARERLFAVKCTYAIGLILFPIKISNN